LQYIDFAQGFEHPNVGSILGLSDSHEPVPFLVLPYFLGGDIITYLMRNPGKTNEEKIELVRTFLVWHCHLLPI
jgi:hypothetical protein